MNNGEFHGWFEGYAGLGRLRNRHGALRDELIRLQNQHGAGPEQQNRRGAGVGGRGGGRGGGGGAVPNPVVNELANIDLDDQAVNVIRGAILDNESREARRDVEAFKLERKRQNTRAWQRERRMEQIEVEKAAVANERRDIHIADGERELEIARRQLDAEREMRRN